MEKTISIDIGGIQNRSIDSLPFNNSPQLREIEANTTSTFNLATSPSGKAIVINRFTFDYVSMQAQQDLILYLQKGNTPYIRSGKKEPSLSNPDGITQDTRDIAKSGAIYSAVSKIGGSFPDNFNFLEESFLFSFENETVKIKIENQSSLFKHSVIIGCSGWILNVRGNNFSQILKQMMGKF